MPGVILLGVLLGFFAFIYTRKASAAVIDPSTEISTMQGSETLDQIFQKYGLRYGVDPLLLKAIAMQESSLNPEAVRNNPPHDISVGLMQVLCIPGANGICMNRFNVEGWDGTTFDMLKDPDKNVQIAAQILAWNLEKFGSPRGIAVYNNWSARTAPVDGPFPNQHYVDRVTSFYADLQAQQ